MASSPSPQLNTRCDPPSESNITEVTSEAPNSTTSPVPPAEVPPCSEATPPPHDLENDIQHDRRPDQEDTSEDTCDRKSTSSHSTIEQKSAQMDLVDGDDDDDGDAGDDAKDDVITDLPGDDAGAYETVDLSELERRSDTCETESTVETASICSMEETCAKIEESLRRTLKMRERNREKKAGVCQPPDVTKLEGYAPVPENAPSWKKAMIEKKNAQLEADAKRKVSEQLAEEEKWKDVPEWKKALIMDREKRRTEDNAPFEAERRVREEEMLKLGQLPDWKRDLIMKKRGEAA